MSAHLNGAAAPAPDIVTLASLSLLPLWVGWQQVIPPLEKPEDTPRPATKLPYSAVHKQAKANDPTTWRTRVVAERVAANLPKPFGIGGIGIEFGTLPDGTALGGIDLDTCRNPESGKIEVWAEEIIEAFDTYAEVSPSKTGVKVFFRYDPSILSALKKAAGMGEKVFGQTFKPQAQTEHPPGIEVYLGGRYFAVTEERLPDRPEDIRIIDAETLLRLLTVLGPKFKGTKANGAGQSLPEDFERPEYSGDPELLARIEAKCETNPRLQKRWSGDWSGLNDGSGSAKAFALCGALKNSGFSFEEMKAALLAHSGTVDWARTKGETDSGRGFTRIWERTELAPHRPEWLELCQTTKSGEPLPNLFNVLVAFREVPELREIVTYDLMLRDPFLTHSVPDSDHPPVEAPRPIRDEDITALQEFLQKSGLRKIGKEVVHQAVDSRALERAFHPVRDYLDALRWDGTPRLKTWLTKYLGAESTPYTNAIGPMFLTAMVARIYDPGCRADYMLILEGDQGERKSTFCEDLAGGWFSDSLPDVHGSDPVRLSMHLRGKWLIEIAEMSAVSKAEAGALKAFLTQKEERYIPKYGRRGVTEPRQCVFIGTTNKEAYLRDETGGRRFWPVIIGLIDLEAFRRDRDQLFAEAVHQYQAGVKWWPDREFEKEFIEPEQEARYEADAWEENIAAYLKDEDKVLIKDVAQGALGIDRNFRLGTADQRRIVAVLKHLDWIQDREKNWEGRRYWRRAK